jgi:hypothetical protein
MPKKYTPTFTIYYILKGSENGAYHRIIALLDFVHRPKLANTRFRKHNLFPPSGERGDTYSVGSLRKSLTSITAQHMSNSLQLYKYLRPGYVKGR